MKRPGAGLRNFGSSAKTGGLSYRRLWAHGDPILDCERMTRTGSRCSPPTPSYLIHKDEKKINMISCADTMSCVNMSCPTIVPGLMPKLL